MTASPSTPLPAALAGRPLTVVDIEGNGQQPPEIVEIALLSFPVGGPPTITNLRTWLVKPSRPITALVTAKVHGITNRQVAGQPRWADVADDIGELLTGRVLVAHNATVERRVLGEHLPRWRPLLVVDTMRLARTVWPGRAGYGLDRLITEAELPAPPEALDDGRRHRAGYDAWMTAQLLLRITGEAELSWDALTTAAQPPSPPPSVADAEGGLW